MRFLRIRTVPSPLHEVNDEKNRKQDNAGNDDGCQRFRHSVVSGPRHDHGNHPRAEKIEQYIFGSGKHGKQYNSLAVKAHTNEKPP